MVFDIQIMENMTVQRAKFIALHRQVIRQAAAVARYHPSNRSL